eukprot:scaffold256051_cov20-Tisochrysis_lutea.AAC.1
MYINCHNEALSIGGEGTSKADLGPHIVTRDACIEKGYPPWRWKFLMKSTEAFPPWMFLSGQLPRTQPSRPDAIIVLPQRKRLYPLSGTHGLVDKGRRSTK